MSVRFVPRYCLISLPSSTKQNLQVEEIESLPLPNKKKHTLLLYVEYLSHPPVVVGAATSGFVLARVVLEELVAGPETQYLREKK